MHGLGIFPHRILLVMAGLIPESLRIVSLEHTQQLQGVNRNPGAAQGKAEAARQRESVACRKNVSLFGLKTLHFIISL